VRYLAEIFNGENGLQYCVSVWQNGAWDAVESRLIAENQDDPWFEVLNRYPGFKGEAEIPFSHRNAPTDTE